MMNVALIALALQLGFAGRATPAAPGARAAEDSARDLRRAKQAQASFEFARRYSLAERYGSNGRCDVHVGRFCWWHDELPPSLPPEPGFIARRRGELIATLDSLGALHPGDEWVTGVRIYYRLEGGDAASAEAVARACLGTEWWCGALRGYANHALGHSASADSAFTSALATMPDTLRCRWRDISTLLPGRARGRYEKLPCAARSAVEDRFWLLSRPELGSGANEFRNEFYVRRILSSLAERASATYLGSWGHDAEELVLRYGWPVAWARVEQNPMLGGFPGVIGYDPVPSFAFAPAEALLDSLVTTSHDDDWDTENHVAESRFAPRLVHRLARVATQLARFRRGDSTLLVASFAASDDSLGAGTTAILGASTADGSTSSAVADSTNKHAMLVLSADPVLAGVEVTDTLTRTLARSRTLLPAAPSTATLSLSDLLLYRGGESPPATLDSALAVAIAGDTVSRTRPVGIYWETYGVKDSSANLDLVVTVERTDHGFLRSARQRVGLAAPDSPLKITWSDARPPIADGAVARAVSLDLANLDPGRYRITVSAARADGTQAASTREIQLGQ